KPKSDSQYKLATLLFAKHPEYKDAFTRAMKPKQKKSFYTKVKNKLKITQDDRDSPGVHRGNGTDGGWDREEEEILPGTNFSTRWAPAFPMTPSTMMKRTWTWQGEAKAGKLKAKLELARLRQEQEHEYRMAQIRIGKSHAGPSSMGSSMFARSSTQGASSGSQTCLAACPQEWRDVWEGRMTERGFPGSTTRRRSQGLQERIRPALALCNVSTIEGFPVPVESLPDFSLEQSQEIVWGVAESGFRFEFCALDKQVSGKERVDTVKQCFAGHMLVGVPLELSKRGWAAMALEERHRYVVRTAALMLDWTTKSAHPSIIRHVAERHPWNTPEMQALETAVCNTTPRHSGSILVAPPFCRCALTTIQRAEGEI
ncbi:hypothetical protein B0H10DRAFT_2355731, partial [Mycena sp. CBHHK59/15]